MLLAPLLGPPYTRMTRCFRYNELPNSAQWEAEKVSLALLALYIFEYTRGTASKMRVQRPSKHGEGVPGRRKLPHIRKGRHKETRKERQNLIRVRVRALGLLDVCVSIPPSAVPAKYTIRYLAATISQ